MNETLKDIEIYLDNVLTQIADNSFNPESYKWMEEDLERIQKNIKPLFINNLERLSKCKKKGIIDKIIQNEFMELSRVKSKFTQYLQYSLKFSDDPLLSKPSEITADYLADMYNTNIEFKISEADKRLFVAGWKHFIPQLVLAVPKIKSWKGRNTILYHLAEVGAKERAVYELAVKCLSDRSAWVRMRACEILGASGNSSAIPHLEPLLNDSYSYVVFSARRAYEALKSGNAYNPHIVGVRIELQKDTHEN